MRSPLYSRILGGLLGVGSKAYNFHRTTSDPHPPRLVATKGCFMLPFGCLRTALQINLGMRHYKE